MKPTSSLFAKILSWFFLNLILVAGVLAVFFAFQPQMNLHALFGRQGAHRLHAAAMLIAHDLNQTPQADWSRALTIHATSHKVDFVLVCEDGTSFASTEINLPEAVKKWAGNALRRPPPPGRFPPPPEVSDSRQPPPKHHAMGEVRDPMNGQVAGKRPPMPPGVNGDKPHFMIRTRHPTRYWSGIRIPMIADAFQRHAPALLVAVSDSVTGNGFFFDPLPWMVVAAAVILISVLLWIPMVRNITRPLARLTHATEEIANGRFDITIHEPRADEIGRLARAINHMTSRLSALVKGQKRFLGDVAHELGSPIARIQFGLGALEQRIDSENRQRVADVMEDVGHMSGLVNELLAFSRADLKSETVQLKRIDLLPMVQEVVKRESEPAAETVIDIDPGLRVVASPELLTRALANLVRNAIKYAGDAGPITISAAKKGNHVEITVRDSGPGVPEDLLDQLFEPFFRPEASRDRDSGGVGLGLAIVKTCIETCRGTVSASNRQPGGFAVTIVLNP